MVYWILFILGILTTRLGVKMMWSYNREKRYQKKFASSLIEQVLPSTIQNIPNPLLRTVRRLLWQASVKGSRTQAIVAILFFYGGTSVAIGAAFLEPTLAEFITKAKG